jgi:hypothetical protein
MAGLHSFNYRVMRHPNGEYAIHEVYYDRRGRVVTWTEDPFSCACPSIEDLRIELERYLLAFDRPALDFEPARAGGESKD